MLSEVQQSLFIYSILDTPKPLSVMSQAEI